MVGIAGISIGVDQLFRSSYSTLITGFCIFTCSLAEEVCVFVAATTNCLENTPLDEAIEKLAHLEFANIELSIRESGQHLKPSEVSADLQYAIRVCESTQRLNVIGYGLEIAETGDDYFRVFGDCCKLAKATKVVTLTVEAGEHGTPFNEEVEKYKQLVKIAEQHGVRVGMRARVGHLSDDPDTVSVICGHVKGLGLTLDPSHYLHGKDPAPNYEHLLGYVQGVYLRDSTKDDLQVCVGQGVIEYGKLINQLRKVNFDRGLMVDIQPSPDVDHDGELRKLRLLLESLLIV